MPRSLPHENTQRFRFHAQLHFIAAQTSNPTPCLIKYTTMDFRRQRDRRHAAKTTEGRPTSKQPLSVDPLFAAGRLQSRLTLSTLAPNATIGDFRRSGLCDPARRSTAPPSDRTLPPAWGGSTWGSGPCLLKLKMVEKVLGYVPSQRRHFLNNAETHRLLRPRRNHSLSAGTMRKTP